MSKDTCYCEHLFMQHEAGESSSTVENIFRARSFMLRYRSHRWNVWRARKSPISKSEHESSQDWKMYPYSSQENIMEGKSMSGAYFPRRFRDHIRERPGMSRSTDNGMKYMTYILNKFISKAVSTSPMCIT